MKNEDTVYTADVGLNWTVIENKLDVGLDYIFSKTVTEINPSTNATASVTLPSINTDLHGLGIRGDYYLKENLRLRLSYRYQSF